MANHCIEVVCLQCGNWHCCRCSDHGNNSITRTREEALELIKQRTIAKDEVCKVCNIPMVHGWK